MGRFEPSQAQCLLNTQKSLSEKYLITFCFSRNFRSEKLFAESFGTREARKIEPWYELSFQNVYWGVYFNSSWVRNLRWMFSLSQWLKLFWNAAQKNTEIWPSKIYETTAHFKSFTRPNELKIRHNHCWVENFCHIFNIVTAQYCAAAHSLKNTALPY